MHILLVEDDADMSKALSRALEHRSIQVTPCYDGATALRLIKEGVGDLVILDLNIPGLDGLHLLQRIRSQGIDTPVIVLTARGAVGDRVAGLNAGADDYLTKPFHFSELVVRLNALLRRNRKENIPKSDEGILTFSDLKLNTWTKTAERAGTEIILSSKEYQLLEMFMRNPNRTLSRDTIAEIVWGIQFDTGTNFIDVYVNYLRKKIEKGFSSKLIHTVIGMGYILKEDKRG